MLDAGPNIVTYMFHRSSTVMASPAVGGTYVLQLELLSLKRTTINARKHRALLDIFKNNF